MGQFDNIMKMAESRLGAALTIANGGQIDMILASADVASKLGPEVINKLGQLFGDTDMARPQVENTLKKGLEGPAFV